MYLYEPLLRHLAGSSPPQVQMSYGDIERLIGRPLPPSAKGKHRRQWWANTPSHVQARAWLDADRKARPIGPELVEFYKDSARREASPTDASPHVRIDSLSSAAQRAIADLAEEKGIALTEAAAALLDRYAVE